MAQQPIAAFFDFDGTLLEDDSARVGLVHLWKTGELSSGFILRMALANRLFQLNLIGEERIARMVIKLYKNRRLETFSKGADEFYESRLRPLLSQKLIFLLKQHQKNGHVTVLLSGSTRYLLAPVAKDLGFAHLICTDLETGPDGRLTGRPVEPMCLGENKRMLAEQLGREVELDLRPSFAYANHHSDIPLLEQVGHPRVVQPTRQLEKTAQQRNWPIIFFSHP